MTLRTTMMCSICRSEVRSSEIRHLPIYATGSEGVDACLPCAIAITEFVRSMQGAAGRASINASRKEE